jgi:hypothetical protein
MPATQETAIGAGHRDPDRDLLAGGAVEKNDAAESSEATEQGSL